MILESNVARLIETCRPLKRVLDVGGWHRPFRLATHVIDIMPYETRLDFDANDPENPQRFTADSWVVQDICLTPWPFPDKFFDFSVCSHTLEDIRDPMAVCRELVRVSRAGYIEVPSRTREIFCKARFARAKIALGRVPDIGFTHHRWFCDISDNEIRFERKGLDSIARPDYYITRAELGRKLSADESGIGLFWEGSFGAREVVVLEGAETGYAQFKKDALARLRGK